MFANSQFNWVLASCPRESTWQPPIQYLLSITANTEFHLCSMDLFILKNVSPSQLPHCHLFTETLTTDMHKRIPSLVLESPNAGFSEAVMWAQHYGAVAHLAQVHPFQKTRTTQSQRAPSNYCKQVFPFTHFRSHIQLCLCNRILHPHHFSHSKVSRTLRFGLGTMFRKFCAAPVDQIPKCHTAMPRLIPYMFFPSRILQKHDTIRRKQLKLHSSSHVINSPLRRTSKHDCSSGSIHSCRILPLCSPPFTKEASRILSQTKHFIFIRAVVRRTCGIRPHQFFFILFLSTLTKQKRNLCKSRLDKPSSELHETIQQNSMYRLWHRIIAFLCIGHLSRKDLDVSNNGLRHRQSFSSHTVLTSMHEMTSGCDSS